MIDVEQISLFWLFEKGGNIIYGHNISKLSLYNMLGSPNLTTVCIFLEHTWINLCLIKL